MERVASSGGGKKSAREAGAAALDEFMSSWKRPTYDAKTPLDVTETMSEDVLKRFNQLSNSDKSRLQHVHEQKIKAVQAGEKETKEAMAANQALHATSEPAPGAASSSHEG